MITTKLRFVLLASVVLIFSLMSCANNNGNTPEQLTESKVNKLVTSFIRDNQISPVYTSFNVGRFRCDDKAKREEYRKLEAAGVVTLIIDTTVVAQKVKVGTDWWTGKANYATKQQTIFTLTTALTKDTKKYIVDENPYKAVVDTDMEQPEIGDFPEFHVDEVICETPDVDEGEGEGEEKENEEYEVVYAKGTNVSLVKVRNIQVGQIQKDCAIFECILQNSKVTPAFRVIEKSYDNQKFLLYGMLQYYVDKGWTVETLSNKRLSID